MFELLIIGFAIAIIFGLIVAARYIRRLARGDSTVWEREIRRFREQDARDPPSSDMIIFTGSSSIKYWKTLNDDMAPLHVLNRGFGGSRIPDVIHYADEIVISYKPKGVVFYAGENDITGLLFSSKQSAEEVKENFQRFCEKVHGVLPSIPIFFISIKPPKRRRKFWPVMQKANQLINEYCNNSSLLHYIDIVPPLLDSEGNARPEFFKWDGIHLNDVGYRIWVSVVKPILTGIFR
ncbi:MAG: GDSL-type esterase/lipase family protein [Candidatus Thorarchaeota archaeon]